MTVAELLDVSYSGGFGFYRYSGMFFEYMEQDRPDLLTELFDRIRSDDPTSVDALFATMASDPDLQQGFDDHLDLRIAQLDSGSGLFAEDVPTATRPPDLPGGNGHQLHSFLSTHSPTATGEFVLWPGRFQYSDVLSVPAADPATLRRQLDVQMDSLLMQLTGLTPNFSSAVAWFGNIEVVGNTANVTYFVEGPYLDHRGSFRRGRVPKR